MHLRKCQFLQRVNFIWDLNARIQSLDLLKSLTCSKPSGGYTPKTIAGFNISGSTLHNLVKWRNCQRCPYGHTTSLFL